MMATPKIKIIESIHVDQVLPTRDLVADLLTCTFIVSVDERLITIICRCTADLSFMHECEDLKCRSSSKLIARETEEKGALLLGK